MQHWLTISGLKVLQTNDSALDLFDLKSFMKILSKSILLPLLAVMAVGCAKEASSSTNELEKDYIEAWLKVNHPDAVLSGTGIYILEDIPGTGALYNGEGYVHVESTITDMEGTISSTTDPVVSQRLGTYVQGNYYGPKIWQISESVIPVGIQDLITGMRKGGTRTALIPSWLATYTRYKKDSGYLKKTSGSSSAIYTVTLKDMFDDPEKWEFDSLASYASRNYGLDRADTLRAGFFYIRTQEPTIHTEFPSDTTIYINYIGRLLDGTVFDTSIADTAKFYGIYSSSGSYGPVKISWAEEVTDIKMTIESSSSSSESTPVTGFQYTLWELVGPKEKGTGLFYSPLGYSTSGSGNSIPSFSPLRFDIEVVDK